MPCRPCRSSTPGCCRGFTRRLGDRRQAIPTPAHPGDRPWAISKGSLPGDPPPRPTREIAPWAILRDRRQAIPYPGPPGRSPPGRSLRDRRQAIPHPGPPGRSPLGDLEGIAARRSPTPRLSGLWAPRVGIQRDLPDRVRCELTPQQRSAGRNRVPGPLSSRRGRRLGRRQPPHHGRLQCRDRGPAGSRRGLDRAPHRDPPRRIAEPGERLETTPRRRRDRLWPGRRWTRWTSIW